MYVESAAVYTTLEMGFSQRSKVSHTTRKMSCEIADISLCYSDYKDTK